ncbi:MAG: ribose 5-phosphate isomerase B [Elusimicrobiota bacterium]
MKIAIASDHRGYILKEKLKGFLEKKGFTVIDNGPENGDSVDYPKYARLVAGDLKNKKASRGILICGSGIGVCIAANKFKGIRAATVRDIRSARMAVTHNNANVLCMGADFTSFEKACSIAEEFLKGKFEGGRHLRRVNQIKEFESSR